MILQVLVDNNAKCFYGEWGLSFFFKDSGKRILFDVGKTDLFIRNAISMGVDLASVHTLVLSHAHDDHTNGLAFLIEYFEKTNIRKKTKPQLIAHPYVFYPREEILNNKRRSNGVNITEPVASRYFDINLTREPFWITKRLVYLGEIERKFGYETRKPTGVIIKPEGTEDDYVWDDSALVYTSRNGLVIITGCAHSGVCNIIEYAKKVCNEERIADIIGGFHLIYSTDKRLAPILEYIRHTNPKVMHPCHCTDLQSKIALAGVTNLREVGVGCTLKYY